MDNHTIIKLNKLINQAYECASFADFLKLSILNLHNLVMYDSGMFFCAISKDCSFFKPYLGGSVDDYYQKEPFAEREAYLQEREESAAGSEAYVYKALDYRQGVVQIADEPRSSFLSSQDAFYVACLRIIYKGQFMGEVYLHRSKEKPDFTQDDLFILRMLQPHISTVFHIIHSLTAVKQMEADSGRTAKKGLCLLDGDLSIISGNANGLEMLKTPTVFGSSTLYHLKEQCAELAEEPGSTPRSPGKTVVLKTPYGQLKIDISIKYTGPKKKAEAFFIVLEYEDEPKIPDYKFKFSKREADIIDGIVQGKNNSQLAKILNLSDNTIKTHIQNIYRKAGANNRTELAYILMLNK